MEIQRLESAQVECALSIWLAASIKAHDFIEAGFWESMVPAMRDTYLPASETWVCVQEGQVLGFLSLLENSLAALFVAPHSQGRGLGYALMKHAKAQRNTLELSVYNANKGAYEFYLRQGFNVVEERLDAHTGHPEVLMEWQAQ
ncbi:N-acetyltransferase [Pseudovibrio sp. SPO723]|uniref:N-acetyltransferase n=1 Tax=Nesiotobacter zosterae TaxID=392721 RepID=UPI0029C4117E|nr:N-acetyltransferase [Pseudovibrio sp. SPO723]MDX5593109.1 N-acetyltransferase [Pseudovibrio sp. SPO723]